MIPAAQEPRLRAAGSSRPNALGSSLVETLVALALLGVVLLATLQIVVHERGVERRLAARLEALAVVERLHETLRGGEPLPGAAVLAEPLVLQLTTGEPLVVSTSLKVSSPPGLYRVAWSARYTLEGMPREVSLETLVWRPGS